MRKEYATDFQRREPMLEAGRKLKAMGSGLTCKRCDRPWTTIIGSEWVCGVHASDVRADIKEKRQRDERARRGR